MADLVRFCLVLCAFLPVHHALTSGTHGTLTLRGSNSSGMVRVFYRELDGAGGIQFGNWGGVCYHDGFGMKEAAVICHQLGYTSASSYSSELRGTDQAVLQDIECSTESYLTLLQCSYVGYLDSKFDLGRCNHLVNVTCFITRIWDDPFDGQIRLTGGFYTNSGLLEVYCNGQWGIVCANDGFLARSAANTVCKQLGYSVGIPYSTLQDYSSRLAWLDDVVCGSSRYNCLGNCQVCPNISFNTCRYYNEDVNIRCGHAYRDPPSTTIDTCVGASVPLTSPEANIGIAVAGVVVGITVLIIVFILIVIFFYIHYKKTQQRPTHHNVNMTVQPSLFKTAVVTSTNSETKTEPTPSKTTTFTSEPPPPYPASEFKQLQAYPPPYPQSGQL